MAAFTMPGFSEVASPPPAEPVVEAPAVESLAPAVVAPVVAVPPLVAPQRPAHLNLDVRHNFGRVDLTVTVDNKRVLDTRLEGAGKKFGIVGRRGERSFTRSLDLQPGVRVVRLRLRSENDKFDHTRVERFELGPAAVAAMRVTVDKAGLDVMTDRPPAPPPPPVEPAPAPAANAAATTAAPPPAAAAPVAASSAMAELYHTLRQVLMALAGFIASVASGFLFEEYLKAKNLSPFQHGQETNRPERRRRARRPRRESDVGIDAGLN